MHQLTSTRQKFEDLVRRILEANEFQIIKDSFNKDKEFDLIATLGNQRWAIEIKHYRTARAQPSLIDSAAARLASNAVAVHIEKGILVVSSVLPADLRESLEKKFGIVVVDQVDLRIWCISQPKLSDELDTLLECSPSEPLPTRYGALDKSPLSERSHIEEAVQRQDTKGTELCHELRGISKGRPSWLQYEMVCEKILKYLFGNDLQGWHSQKRTDDGLNRYDYICRARPTTEFWNFAIDHLDSRYVLFEFKNYTGKIKQGQILTTEKYLLERGFRRLAIIMTRVGADQNALAMAQGAMREQGKLMLILNDDIVCRMLHMKENGDDPSDYLFDIADDFLMKLPR